MRIEIKSVTEVDIAAVEALYRDADWWEDDYVAAEFIPEMVANSIVFAGAFLPDSTMVGMGRAIGDGVSDAYIQDVAVLSDYRKHGIGSMLVKHLVNALQELGVDWIGLIGEPGTGKFYQRLGFRELNGFIPMKLA